jgi:hypothetical protein
MKINFSQVYEGWKNNLFPATDMKPMIEQVSEERMIICKDCDLISSKHKTVRPDLHCTDCGCTLSAKTRCLSCDCPRDYWKAVIDSLDKEHEIKTAIDGRK